MTTHIFYTGLDDLRMRYTLPNPQAVYKFYGPLDWTSSAYQRELDKQKRKLFEQLCIFESLDFKVVGPNVTAAILYAMLGEHTFESLLDQNAIRFTVWDQFVSGIGDAEGNTKAFWAGYFSAPGTVDTQKTLEQGFYLHGLALPKSKFRRFAKIINRRQSVLERGRADAALNVVRSALKAGKLERLGLLQSDHEGEMPAKKSAELIDCVEGLLEYRHIVDTNQTSFSEYKFYSPFDDAVGKFRDLHNAADGFAKLSRIERLPDLQEVYAALDDPFKRMARFRQTRNARLFRTWLDETSEERADSDFVKEYIDDIVDRRGFFDSKKGKIIKSVAMAGIGSVLSPQIGAAGGAAMAALGGAMVGPLAETSVECVRNILEKAGDLGFDLLDELVLERVLEGWTPRMYFDGLRALHKKGAVPNSESEE